MHTENAPLIVTLDLEPAAAARFEALRQRLFPPDRNVVPAHVSLFHALPGIESPSVLETVGSACAGRDALSVRVTGLRSLGAGVAYTLESPALTELRASFADTWQRWLTPQDRQGFRPHVVVQNKVSPDVARRTLAELREVHVPFDVTATGIAVWRYLGGPWALLAHVPFGAA